MSFSTRFTHTLRIGLLVLFTLLLFMRSALLPASAVQSPDEVIPITADNMTSVRLLGVLPGDIQSPFYLSSKGAVSLDGTHLISAASYTTSPRAWSLLDFSSLGTPTLNPVELIVASPQGDLIAHALRYEPIIRLWSVTAGTDVGVMTNTDMGQIDQLLFSPDGTMLIARGDGMNTWVWDIATRTERFVLPAEGLTVFSPDSRMIAIALRGGEAILVYDSATGEERFLLDVNQPLLTEIVFSPDGTLIAVEGEAGIGVWSPSGESRAEIAGDYSHLAFSTNGQFFAALQSNDVLRVWQTSPFQMFLSFNADSDAGLAFSHDSALIAFGNPLQFFSLSAAGKITLTSNYRVFGVEFSADGSMMFVQGNGSTLVFGIPTSTRPEWTPPVGRIVPSGVNLRTPAEDAEVIGYATGDVTIGGRARSAVYLPDLGGWIWSDPLYLDLGDLSLFDLPEIYITPTEAR